jgi:hypothetical protein
MTRDADADRLAQLKAEASYARQRLDLYRARVYAGKSTRHERLEELERISSGADERLRRAQAAAAAAAADE